MTLKSIDLWLTNWSLTLILFMILVVGIIYTGIALIDSFNPQEYSVAINVTGLTNATNSSIAIVQLDCIKYCIDRVSTNYDYQGKCMDRCLKIGENNV